MGDFQENDKMGGWQDGRNPGVTAMLAAMVRRLNFLLTKFLYSTNPLLKSLFFPYVPRVEECCSKFVEFFFCTQ